MGTLDTSIVNISFPKLAKVFETELSVVIWVTVAYLLVGTGLMLILGRIGDVFGRKKVYILGFVLFTIGLILCSLSQSILQLILSRIIQGVGAAVIVALSSAIVTAAFPDQERGKALGILGSVISAGILIGPVLGGFLLDILDWRSIFYTRVPVGIIGLVIAWILLKEQKASDISLKFDLWGAATLFGSLSFLLLFFNLGVRLGFVTPPVLILAGSAVILLVLFIAQERRTEQPLVDLNLFRNHLFAGGNISLGIMTLTVSALILLMPFYLIDGIGYSALETGLFLAAASVITLVIAPLSGWLSDKVGSRLLCTVGMTLICLSLFLFSGLSNESSSASILLSLVVFGIGTGVFTSPNSSSIMGAVPNDRLGTASALMYTIRQIGMSTGIAVAGAIFTSRQFFHAAQLTHDNLDPLMLHKLSLVGGYQDTLLMAAIVCSIGIFTSLTRGRKQPNY